MLLVALLLIVLAKSQSTKGASLQPSFMGTWLLVTRVCPVYLVDKLVLVFYTALWLG